MAAPEARNGWADAGPEMVSATPQAGRAPEGCGDRNDKRLFMNLLQPDKPGRRLTGQPDISGVSQTRSSRSMHTGPVGAALQAGRTGVETPQLLSVSTSATLAQRLLQTDEPAMVNKTLPLPARG